MTREEAARALGAEATELETALHEPPGAEVRTTACGLRMDQAAAAWSIHSPHAVVLTSAPGGW